MAMMEAPNIQSVGANHAPENIGELTGPLCE